MVADKILKDEEKKNKVFDPEDKALNAVRKVANYFAVEDWLSGDRHGPERLLSPDERKKAKERGESYWSPQGLTMYELENVHDGIRYESKKSNSGEWIRDWIFAKGPDGKPIGGEPKYANEAFDAVSKLAILYLDQGEINTLWKLVNENKYKEKKMKITKSQLRKIIKEELENISEMGRRGASAEWEYKAQIEEPQVGPNPYDEDLKPIRELHRQLEDALTTGDQRAVDDLKDLLDQAYAKAGIV